MDSFFRTSSMAVIGILLIAIVFGACDDEGDDTLVGSGENTPSTGEEGTPESPPEGSLDVRLRDFAIEMPESAPAGEMAFVVTNEGPSTHDFIILETELDAGDLPMNAAGQVDLESDEVIERDGIRQVPYEEFDTLTTTLPQGEYVVICNVAGHYDEGMYTTFAAE